MGVFLAFGILAIGCLAVAGNEIADEINQQIGPADDADYDVTRPTCRMGEVSGMDATGTIRNTSDERRAFQVEIHFTDAAGRTLSQDATSTGPIDVGESVSWRVSSFADLPSGGARCAISEVRYSTFDEPAN